MTWRSPRFWIVVVVVVAAVQAGTWITYGRASLSKIAATDILGAFGDDCFLDAESLSQVPDELRPQILAALRASGRVSLEAQLPGDNRLLVRRTDDGEGLFQYRVPVLSVDRWTSSPLGARVEFSIYHGPVAALGYSVNYAWVIGFWVRRGAPSQTWLA